MKSPFARVLVTSVLAVIASLMPGVAHSAELTTATVETTGLVSGSVNPNPITVTMTVATGGVSDGLAIDLPEGWTWVNEVGPANPCSPSLPVDSVTGISHTFCRANYIVTAGGPGGEMYLRHLGVFLNSGDTVVVVISAGSINVGDGTQFILAFTEGPTVKDSSVVTVGAGGDFTNGGSEDEEEADTLARTGVNIDGLAGTMLGLIVVGALLVSLRRRA